MQKSLKYECVRRRLGCKNRSTFGEGRGGQGAIGGGVHCSRFSGGGGGQVELLLKSYHLMKTTSFFEQVCQPIELGP